jgi:hypothetical protein
MPDDGAELLPQRMRVASRLKSEAIGDASLSVLVRPLMFLLNSLNEVIRSLVGPNPARTRALPRPHEMAMLAIKVLFNEAELSRNTEREVRQNGMSSKLWVQHAQRSAFRATDRVAQRTFTCITIQQELFCALEFVRRNLKANARFWFGDEPKSLQPSFTVKFRRET